MMPKTIKNSTNNQDVSGYNSNTNRPQLLQSCQERPEKGLEKKQLESMIGDLAEYDQIRTTYIFTNKGQQTVD